MQGPPAGGSSSRGGPTRSGRNRRRAAFEAIRDGEGISARRAGSYSPGSSASRRQSARATRRPNSEKARRFGRRFWKRSSSIYLRANVTSRRILLAGYYGFGNAGDEAILFSILAHLRAAAPEAVVTVVSGDPEATAKAHGVEAVFWRDPLGLEDAARDADLVVLGGGGIFHDYWGFPADAILTDRHWGLSFYAAPAVLALLHGKPLMIYAAGVGPLETAPGREFTKAVCDVAATITVRDEESRDELAALGVPFERIEVTADPAFAFEPRTDAAAEPLPALPDGRPLLGVALRHWDVGVDPAKWEAEVAGALDRFLETAGRGGAVLFLPFQQESVAEENDAAVAARVRERMRHGDAARILPGGSDPARLAAAIGQCDLVLAMRLHAGVFAATAGVPVVSLEYDPKVSRLMRQIGQPDYALPLAAIDAGGLASRLAEAFEERGRYARHLVRAGPDARAQRPAHGRDRRRAPRGGRGAGARRDRRSRRSAPPDGARAIPDGARADGPARRDRAPARRNRAARAGVRRTALGEGARGRFAFRVAARRREARRGRGATRPARGGVPAEPARGPSKRAAEDPQLPLLESPIEILGAPAETATSLRGRRPAAQGGRPARGIDRAVRTENRARPLPRASLGGKPLRRHLPAHHRLGLPLPAAAAAHVPLRRRRAPRVLCRADIPRERTAVRDPEEA